MTDEQENIDSHAGVAPGSGSDEPGSDHQPRPGALPEAGAPDAGDLLPQQPAQRSQSSGQILAEAVADLQRAVITLNHNIASVETLGAWNRGALANLQRSVRNAWITFIVTYAALGFLFLYLFTAGN